MKKSVRPFLLVAVTVLVWASGAGATHGPSGGPPRDFANGVGDIGGDPPLRFTINSKSSPLGEDPRGRVSAGGLEAEIRCMVTTGNRATAGGEMAGFPGNFLFVSVEDNGSNAPDRVNALSSVTIPADAAGCVAAHAFLQPELLPVTNGNFLVHDGL